MFVPETSEYYCKECKSKGVYYLEDQEVCPGHDTEMEACEHYRQYLLDKARYDQVSKDIQKKCDICRSVDSTSGVHPVGDGRTLSLR
jgi:hypothetical protein